MAFSISISNLNETGIKLASSLLPEIQRIILKFMIEDFLCFIDGIEKRGEIDIFDMYYIDIRYDVTDRCVADLRDLLFSDHTTIKCSNNIQAQILSMTGYDDLLDDIICMALEELDLTLKLEGSSYRTPFIDEFINFVTSRSVQLKNVEVLAVYDFTVKEFTNPNRMKLLEFHPDRVSFDYVTIKQQIPSNYLALKFVDFLSCSASLLSQLLDSGLLNKLTSLTKISVKLYFMEEFSNVEEVMEHLQLSAPSVKHLYLDSTNDGMDEELCVDLLVQADTFIRKHKNLNIQFDITFLFLPINFYWRFDSKTEISLPLHTTYPMHPEDVDKIEQWLSVPGTAALRARDPFQLLMRFPTDTEMILFTRAINSTLSVLVIDNFSAEYEIVLDGFSSLKKLEISYSVLKKFPSLPESLRELTIKYVNDLSMSDMNYGILFPTRLCTLMLHGNICCFGLPKILNIEKLICLKDVSVNISPFHSNGICGEELYDLEDYVIRNFLRLTNTCTIDQLQQFVSQLPSDLEILKINIYGCIRPSLDNYSACCPDKLSFKRFTNLNYLECNCFSNDNLFNVSIFPAVEHLSFISHPVLTGCFAQGIKSLEVNLGSYRESVSHFLSHFISKLTSLVSLSINIDIKTSADIRGIASSSQLCFFRIIFCEQYCWRFEPAYPNEYSSPNEDIGMGA
ncbi:unnamed protein product [Ambrosiozyma monospora]|uniref:Unnamed protein product n=1 Tax=Ambrosiozyma monospora TaxID=43982 RepID=A0A9W6Z1K7_AMBMO|nr:unnamed protein product [Ambrosiozyma monospora]